MRKINLDKGQMSDRQNQLFEGGKKVWEQTDLYDKKVNSVKQELRDKYQVLLKNERSWTRRLLIKIRFQIELKKKMDEISSWKNLHFASR